MAKKTKKIEEVVYELSDLLLHFDSGDLIGLTDISVKAQELSKECEGKPIIHCISQSLVLLIEKEFKESNSDFVRIASTGVDHFIEANEAIEAKKEFPDWKKKRVADWVQSINPKKKACNNDEKEKISGASKLSKAESIIQSEHLAGFVSDAKDRLSRVEELLLLLDEDMGNLDFIKELFRIFHTIKGECGFLKLTTLGSLTHNIENLLDLLRSEKISVTTQVVDLLLRGLDYAKNMLQQIEDNQINIENPTIIDSYVASLNNFTNETRPTIGSIMIQKGLISETEEQEILKQQAISGFKTRFGEIAVENKYVDKKEVDEILIQQKQSLQTDEKQEGYSDQEQAKKIDKGDPIIKVRASKVNYLVDMIGELLISLGQIQGDIAGLSEVKKISRTLQHSSMQLRTESVKVLFITVKRIIRDISLKLNKQVHAHFIGDDLEIDRQLIESLEEPLMHLIRNSLDHGIESEAERLEAGKPAMGELTIAAERRGNNIVISVSDDGKGLNKEDIITKAVEKELISEDAIESMTDTAIYNLIYLPGFSTKKQADLLSGRGVGMDIIKEAVIKSKGRIDTYSEPGKGTTFDMVFPLSTAIIDGMIIRTGKNLFIIPIAVIMESIKIKPEMVNTVRSGTQVLNLRDEVIPMISLASVFDIKEAEKGEIATIVESSNREKYAIVSDEVLSKNEIVIKSLGARFRDMKGISSGTVLAGGTIGLVLDVDQFIQLGIEESTEKSVEVV